MEYVNYCIIYDEDGYEIGWGYFNSIKNDII